MVLSLKQVASGRSQIGAEEGILSAAAVAVAVAEQGRLVSIRGRSLASSSSEVERLMQEHRSNEVKNAVATVAPNQLATRSSFSHFTDPPPSSAATFEEDILSLSLSITLLVVELWIKEERKERGMDTSGESVVMEMGQSRKFKNIDGKEYAKCGDNS